MSDKQKITEYGTVVAIRHPLITVTGLPTIMPAEVVRFDNQQLGQVFSFTHDLTQIISFSNQPVSIGSQVHRTHQPISINLPSPLGGVIIDPLGQILFGANSQASDQAVLIDKSPPPLSDRVPITQTLRTGMSIVDILLPLAQGQREMISGDKKTGKTDFTLKLIRTQALEGHKIVWAAIAKKKDDVKRLYEYCQKYQICDHITFVVSFASDSPSMISLTPFSAMSIAEKLKDQGHSVVVILDDLTSHAQSYRELSLLAKRFPGRDSYPGDIFHLHARLLERAGTFRHPQDKNKTVSISCLPLSETTDSDLTSYINSNLISITDGHLLFDTSLFQQGRRPAIHHSLSVTRVGKQTQSSLEREITLELTSFLTNYHKTQEMTHFSAELTQSSRRTLRIGAQLEAFFTETSDLILPKDVQLVMIAMIWHGWLINVQSKSLQTYRDKLAIHCYQDPKVKQALSQLTQVKHFVQLLEITKTKQQWLLSLCQV